MRRFVPFLSSVLLAAVVWLPTLPAGAANQQLTGTISSLVLGVQQQGAQTISFKLAGQTPPATGCPVAGSYFTFSPNSVTDAPTRNNMLAVLLTAQATGAQIVVTYDDSGKYCDPFGFPSPIGLQMLAQ